MASSVAFQDGPNTFLKLVYQNTSGVPQRFSNSAHSLIKHMRVISSQGVDLENIREYWQIHAALSDLLLSGDNRDSRQHEGYGSAVIESLAAVGATAAAEVVLLRAGYDASRANQNCTNELTVAPNQSVTLCIPLELSSSIGSGQKKLLPLFLMGEITLELELNAFPVFNTAGGGGAAADVVSITYSVCGVELHASLIEFDASVNMALSQMVATSG